MTRILTNLIAATLLAAAPASAQSKAKAQNVPEIPYDSVPNFFELPPNLSHGVARAEDHPARAGRQDVGGPVGGRGEENAPADPFLRRCNGRRTGSRS
jgi:hypothetical protein